MKTEDRHSVWFCSNCNGMADNASLFVEYFRWIGFYVSERSIEQGGYYMSRYFDGRNGRLSKTGRSLVWGDLLELELLPFYLATTKSF